MSTHQIFKRLPFSTKMCVTAKGMEKMLYIWECPAVFVASIWAIDLLIPLVCGQCGAHKHTHGYVVVCVHLFMQCIKKKVVGSLPRRSMKLILN